MTDRVETVVVGGGIVGTATAYHLARAGVDTLLVDRAHEGRATDAGAGILSPATSSRTEDDDWFAFATAAVSHYPDLVDRLEAAGLEHGYAERDLLTVAVEDDEVPAFEAALVRTESRAGEFEGSIEELTPAEAADLFPPLADVERALRFTGAARVDGGLFTNALRRLSREEGLRTRTGTVEEIRVERGDVTDVTITAAGGASQVETTSDGRERLAVDSVVVAGGAWSDAFADDLDIALPVEPMRGQIAHLDVSTLREGADTGTGADSNTGTGARTDPDREWPIVAAFHEHYLAPWPGDRVVAGATREPDAGYDPRRTAGGVSEVLDEALRVAPGLADAELAEVRVGLRPSTPDGRPILGEAPDVNGAYLATGHGPTGLMLGPYSGKLVADLVCGEEPAVDISPFAPDRF